MKAKALGIASHTILLITVVLFVVSIFEKGFTRELLLETAVFLVSVKLVLATERTEESSRQILGRLEKIEKRFER